MKTIKFRTHNYDGEAKKVGKALIGNETIPVFEFSVKLQDEVDLFEILWLNKNFSEYEQEFLDLAQKALSEIENNNRLFVAFIACRIWRDVFSKVVFQGSDNPLQGVVEAWRNERIRTDCERADFKYPAWLTLVESPANADKRENDEVFQTSFEKWALAQFLQLTFGHRFLPFTIHYYSDECPPFGNGKVNVGNWKGQNLNEFSYWTDNGMNCTLPEAYILYPIEQSEQALELLYWFLKGKLQFDDIFNLFDWTKK